MKFMQVRLKKQGVLVKSTPIKWGWLLLALLISTFSYANKPKLVTPKPTTLRNIAPTPHNLIAVALKNNISLTTNPPDQIVTACGNSTVLTASNIPPNYSNLTWNDGSTGSTLNVTSSGTYWWQVTGASVVANGDFSQGDTGFASSYTDVTTNHPNGSQLVPESAYAVGTNPSAYHNAFYSYGDHTNGTGNMLIVNGAFTANVKVWSQNITVTANTDYVFSVWIRSASLASVPAPAVLQFSINGTPLGSTLTPTSSAATSAWQFFTTTWNSGSTSGRLPIALINQNIIKDGNDFAMDDIVFAPVYRQSIVVTLNPNPVLAVTGPNAACGVYDLTKSITDYDPATYTYLIKDAANNVVTNAQSISRSGVYTITETNKTTGCQSAPQQVTVTINPNPQKPGISSL
jgi:hypothetical protein